MPLGGAVCIAGGIRTKEESTTMMMPRRSTKRLDGDSSAQRRPQQRNRNGATDVLIIAGSNDVVYSKEDAQSSKRYYDHPSKVRVHVQQGKGHSMIGSEDEMRAVMEFLSKRLVRRMVSMEGRCG
mmetsp:Transcript_3851/g.8656  ORF Transcript_3851/g.8656 Transcript_3851/m.8656 type:complete len:125 (+) Transcript_3851:3-377(+)